MIPKTNTFEHKSDVTKDPYFRAHDVYNMVYLSYISILDFYYLYQATNFALIGTDQLGKESMDIFVLLWRSFMLYMAIDTIWISITPHIAPSGAKIVIAHHAITILYALLPLYIPEMSWHMGVALTNELSTAFVTFRRNVPLGSWQYQVMHYLVLFTWFPIRVVLYPGLCVFVYLEYRRYSHAVQTYKNILLFGLFAQLVLTYLGLSWTVDLIKKLRSGTTSNNNKKKE